MRLPGRKAPKPHTQEHGGDQTNPVYAKGKGEGPDGHADPAEDARKVHDGNDPENGAGDPEPEFF